MRASEPPVIAIGAGSALATKSVAGWPGLRARQRAARDSFGQHEHEISPREPPAGTPPRAQTATGLIHVAILSASGAKDVELFGD